MDREAIEEAIEVLEDASAEMLAETGDENYYAEAIAVLRQALETEQEPVAWISDSPTKGNGKQLHWTKSDAWRWSSNITPLYTAPPKRDLTCVCGAVWDGEMMVHPPKKREWVGLHGSEVPDTYKYDVMFMEGWLWAEERLKEKNHG
jgi:hypothetical protein